MENTTQTQTRTPKAPRSAAQIAASRANGAKSRGPVTPDGKVISAQNADRHGIFASICTIPGEIPEKFAAILANLYQTWAPTDEHERCLVDTMGMAVWRRARVAALQSAGIALQLHKILLDSALPESEIDSATQYLAVAALADQGSGRAFELLHRYEKAFTRMHERAARSLMAYRKFREEFPPAPETDPDDDPQPEPAPQNEPQSETTPRPQPQPEPEIKNQRNEPEPRPDRRLSRRERRQQKWQKAHPRANNKGR